MGDFQFADIQTMVGPADPVCLAGDHPPWYSVPNDPSRKWGRGPDNLLQLWNNTYWVVEAKSGASSKTIGIRDAAQLGQAVL